MVAISNKFRDKEDKEKLTTSQTNEADLEAYEVYIAPTVLVPRRYSRTRFFIRLLFLLTCLLFGICLIIGGVLLYRYFTTPRSFSIESCSVRYRSQQRPYLIDKGGLNADDVLDKPIFKPKETLDDGDDDDGSVEVGELKQNISLNMTSQTEEIIVPNSLNYKKAIFFHDFIRNWSAIFDFDAQKCFIFPLDRSKISPPKDMFDLIYKAKTLYYLPENILLHKKMVVDRKLVNEDLHDFGNKIDSMCHDTASYLLGENRILNKRDTVEKRCEHSSNFIESAGKFTLAYHLVC